MTANAPRRTGFLFGPVPLGYMAAVILATLLGTVIQTQANLLALQSVGAGVTPGQWLLTTGKDLAFFSPILFILTAIAFLAALPAAALVSRMVGQGRPLIFAVAAGVGLLVAFRVVDHLAPMPTLIAATRGIIGTLAMMAAAGAGGWLFARMTESQTSRGTP